jgi:TM2 domain-containing membrane protein YozV
MVYCRGCGKELHETAPLCPHCGAPQPPYSASDRRLLPALLLCLFLGWLGAHRFYVGKVGTGILMICTFGGFFGLWVLIDLIMILVGAFTDKNGEKLTVWT